MSREENPFSFNNFNTDDTATDLPFPTGGSDATTSKKSKRKKSRKKPAASTGDFDVFAETRSSEEANPFSFKSFDDNCAAEDSRDSTKLTSGKDPAIVGKESNTKIPLPMVAVAEDEVSDLSSSDDGSDNHGDGPAIPGASQLAVGADDTDDSWDSEDNDDVPTLPRPIHTESDKKGTSSEDSGGQGSILARVKRRITLLKEQLTAKDQELRMCKEQYAMDIEELREYNATLRSEVKQSRAAIAKAEKKAAAAESELKRRMHTDKKEAAVLEDFTQRVEANLETTTARAVAAEAKVASLTAELQRYKECNMPQGAVNQIKSASVQLKELSKTSEKSLKSLMDGAKTLAYVADILKFAERVAEDDDDFSD